MAGIEQATMRRMPIRTGKVVLVGSYEGWTAEMRVNPPLRVLQEMESGNMDRVKEAMASLIISWDFVDEEGEPLKPAGKGGIEQCPIDLLQDLATQYGAYMREMAALPKD